MTRLLAVADVGGTHTTVAVAESPDRVLGRADGPGAAVKPGLAPASAAIIREVLGRAAAAAGLDPDRPPDALVVGAAGAGRPQEREALQAALLDLGAARRVQVLPDAELSLRAAFGQGEPGVVLNAGTGSIAFARTPDGALHRAGGFGWQMSDEGGGYWIGRAALAAAGRATDGRGPGTTLPSRLLAALGLKDFDGLVRWAQAATPPQVAALAPHVLQAAREGEAVARTILAEGAAELALLARALVDRFPGDGPVRLAILGGLLRGDQPFRTAVVACLETDVPRARLADRLIDVIRAGLEIAAQEGREQWKGA